VIFKKINLLSTVYTSTILYIYMINKYSIKNVLSELYTVSIPIFLKLNGNKDCKNKIT